MRHTHSSLLSFALVLSLVFLGHPLQAQSLWSEAGPGKSDACTYDAQRGETIISCLDVDFTGVASFAKTGLQQVDVTVDGDAHVVRDVRWTAPDGKPVSMNGNLDGESFATFFLSVAEGSAAGSFSIRGRSFEVRPTAGGRSVLLEIDPFARRVSHLDTVVLPSDRGAWSAPRAIEGIRKGGASGQIDLLMLWDDAVLSANGSSGLAALEASFVDYLNQAVVNGGSSDITFNVVHSEVITYNENQFSDMGDDLTGLADGTDGVLDEAHTLRRQHGADLVHLMLPSFKGDTCGIAYQPLNAVTQGFGITGVSGCDLVTFAHEIGHNMGMGHDSYVSPAPQDVHQLWSYGFLDLGAAVHTIMAYDNQCFDNNITCQVIPYFSDPDRTVNGVRIGIADDAPNIAANNFRVMRENAAARAGYSDLLTACLADVYGGETGTTAAMQGEELTFNFNLALNTLVTNCSSDPTYSVYLVNPNTLSSYFVARRTVSLGESPTPYPFSGIPSDPSPPVGSYQLILVDDASGGYYAFSHTVAISAGSGVATESISLPEGYRLASAYPNPFNPSTRIAFEVGGAEPVSIRVFDLLGRERASLLNEAVLAVGDHSIAFEARGLASGTYLIHMQVGGGLQVMPVVLAK